MLEFAPICIYLVISLLVSLILLGVPFLFSSNSSTNPKKLLACKCGFDPFGDARSRFDIRFYLVSILFIILDPEVTFTLPPHQVACGLADTFVHVMEQYMTVAGQSRVMDRWAEGILQTLVEIAPKIRENQHDYQLMADFMLSATMALNGFIAMGVSQDWATHMIGHEITALHGLTHGHTLVIILPATLRVLREAKGDKLVQYGERVWGITSGTKEERIDEAIDRTEEFFRSLGLTTRLHEENIGEETVLEIERRFNERGAKYGENENVTGAVARKILEAAL